MGNRTLNTTKQLVGMLIKHHRKEKEMSQQNLADLLGTDRQYIWRIEKGLVNLSLDYLDKIIIQLKCTHMDFFKPVINASFYK